MHHFRTELGLAQRRRGQDLRQTAWILATLGAGMSLRGPPTAMELRQAA
jgi:hypothetical protein